MDCMQDVQRGRGLGGYELMPKGSFKSITVPQKVYDKFHQNYENNKEYCYKKGISSFAGYITHLISERMKENEIMKKNNPIIRMIVKSWDRVLLMDERMDRIIEVKKTEKGLVCQFCESDKCSHIGFCYSLHQLYPLEKMD